MIGAILAGGFGKRMRSFSPDTPKGLIQISEGVTILHRQLFDFSVMGIRDVYILSGYRGEKIEETFGDSYLGMNMHYLTEEKPMGTLFSLNNLLSVRMDEDIVLRNGDTVSDINYREFARYSQRLQQKMIMCIVRMRSPYGIVEFSGNSITSFVEKPLLSYYINAGIYYIKQSAFEYFGQKYHNKDLEKSAFPEIVKRGEMGAYREESFWIGIDSEKEVELARVEYAGRKDHPWGFMKSHTEGKSVKVIELYVKEREIANIGSKRKGILKIDEGSCLIPGRDGTLCHQGSTVTVDAGFSIEALENVRALFIETG